MIIFCDFSQIKNERTLDLILTTFWKQDVKVNLLNRQQL